MKPPAFTYSVPSTLDEAVALLTEHAAAEPRVLAGGQSLIPLMNFRLAQPGHLVDLRKVAELAGIRAEGDVLVIGAMTRQSDVERSPEVALLAPLLAEAVTLVGHTPIRNSGTIGGSLAHADPAAELPAAALALDAELVVAGPGGPRVVPAAEFLLGPFATALAADELLTEVRVPRQRGGHAFVEFARTHGNFAVVAVAALIELDGERVRRATLALTGVAPTAIRAAAAERVLIGAVPAEETLTAAADAAVADLRPAGDLHASAATRIDLARTYIRRAVTLAVRRARDQR
jgi:aerobic carbon-monoxide dehydrogenase medium subunit